MAGSLICQAQDQPSPLVPPLPDPSQQNRPLENPPQETPNQSSPTEPSNQSPPNQPAPNQSAPNQNQPTNSQAPKKEGSANRAAEMAEATKKFGATTLGRVRDWEAGWFTGPYVSRSRNMVPLTGQQRREIYLQQTLTTPSSYFKRMFAAGVDQARHSPSQWPEGWNGYGERFASREGQFIVANSLAALGNAALKYEPRYDQCQCAGFRLRTRHAILRNFVTYNVSEQAVRPQWALYGGAFGGGLVSTAWKPHPRNAFAEGGRAMLGQAAYGALLNFFIEFAGDINRKLGAKH